MFANLKIRTKIIIICIGILISSALTFGVLFILLTLLLMSLFPCPFLCRCPPLHPSRVRAANEAGEPVRQTGHGGSSGGRAWRGMETADRHRAHGPLHHRHILHMVSRTIDHANLAAVARIIRYALYPSAQVALVRMDRAHTRGNPAQ